MVKKRNKQQRNLLQKKKWLSVYRLGGWAAAAVIAAAGNSMTLLMPEEIFAENVQQEAVSEEEEFQVVWSEEAVFLNEQEETEEKDTIVTSSVLHPSSYQEIYELLQLYEEHDFRIYSNNYKETIDIAAEDFMVEESAMGSDNGVSSGSMTSSSDFSTTNVREAGIEEADCVKTDGSYIYAMDSEGRIRILDIKEQKLLSEIPVEQEKGRRVELYVEGDRLQIIRNAENYVTLRTTRNEVRSAVSHRENQTIVSTYDISDRSHPVLTDTFAQDGYYLTSRKKDGFLYLFTSYRPQADLGEDLVESYIPEIGEELFSCEEICYLQSEEEQMQYDGSGFLVASSIPDANSSKEEDRICIINGTGLFYVSQNNVYAAAASWRNNQDSTDLLRFGYAEGKFEDGCSAKIPGIIKDSFCMDEYEGMLRLVTTVNGNWQGIPVMEDIVGNYRANRLYILDQNLQIVGRIRGIAMNEEIKSARFMGEKGYFVTYENKDPLFSVDLSDPENPKLLGKLSVTGFSEYLHPYGENLLLGIGWETDPDNGRFEGLKCSMFDTADLKDVREIDRLILSDADFSEAMNNYKAILVDPEKNLFGFSYGGYGDSYESNYYYGVFSYENEIGFVPKAYLEVPGQKDAGWDFWNAYRNARGVYVGDYFYLVNDYGIYAYDMGENFQKKAEIMW